MNIPRLRFSPAIGLAAILFCSITAEAQTSSAAEWSTRIWSSASDGNWEAVDVLLSDVPEGDDVNLVAFRNQLEAYRNHIDHSTAETLRARELALEEMKMAVVENNIIQAMKSAVEAQTLSKNFDDVMYMDDVQSVLSKAQEEIARETEDGNILTAQTLLYSLRTFYEGTSRRDLYDLWSDELEDVALQVSLLRQYAPEHLHSLFTSRAETLGDEPPEAFNEQARDNWIQRVDDINTDMVVRSLDVATNEHIQNIDWRELILGGLTAVQTLGNVEVIAETFVSVQEDGVRDAWNAALDEEFDALQSYLEHIPGKRVLVQILRRILQANETTLKLPEGVILREFGDGAMSKLDKYSGIIWPDESRRFAQQTNGRFVGVGINIQENNKGEIKIASPIEGSPAYNAGVLPDDVIVAVNGKSASGWTLNDAVDRITGPKGTPVTLTIRRPTEEEQLDITITRDSIKLHSVQGWWKENLNEDGQPNWNWYIDETNKIGYIKLTGFSDESYSDILSAVREMQTLGQPNGLILDLRFNPGGLLPSARRIANLFVSSGTIVSGEKANGEEIFRMRALPNRAYLSDWPVLILINQGSASASEIVSGCVQAHDAGIIVGKQSWGKGSVQTVHQVARDANVKLTTQFYRLPSPDGGLTPGRLVHKHRGSTDWGVIPDIEVAMSPTQITESMKLRKEADMISKDSTVERPDINRLITDGLDPQLETALLILRANALSRMTSDHRQASLD